MFTKFLTTAVATVAVFSTLTSGYAVPTSPLDTRAAAPKLNFTPKHLIGLEHALQVINAIPDSVLTSGDAAAAAWVTANTATIQSQTTDLILAPSSGATTSTDLIVVQDLWAVAFCAAAVAEFLISNLIPAAKLLKLKGIISKLGGITKAIQLLIASRGNLAAAAELVKQLVEILSGFSTVASRCL